MHLHAGILEKCFGIVCLICVQQVRARIVEFLIGYKGNNDQCLRISCFTHTTHSLHRFKIV